MKVIFLDIDGVLNTEKTYEKIYNEYILTNHKSVPIDEEKIIYLKEIVEATTARIILSSSWRRFCEFENNKIVSTDTNMNYLINILKKYNLEIYDITSYEKNGHRGLEIEEWLTHHKVESFIIFDDIETDLKEFNEELIQTNSHIGLTKNHINLAIEKLNLNKNDFKIRSLHEISRYY